MTHLDRSYTRPERIAYDEGWLVGFVMASRFHEHLRNPKRLTDDVRQLANDALKRIEEIEAEL